MRGKNLSLSSIQAQILKLHDELEREHHALPANWLGKPRKRHHQILGASRALKELFHRLTEMAKENGP